jgi:alpha-mannosidase
MARKTVHLVSNAHLDPVWLWTWEEGAAEALSTFRAAADFCEKFDGFIFNHNEAVLYQWVEAYDPDLFQKIRHLVHLKKWHIMGGWFLQPDCNMPCGESFVRQILMGKRYFKKAFNVDVATAANLDPFGHTRGLVQILAKSGYDSYLFCRPDKSEPALPAEDFLWVGFDGSEVMATIVAAHYNSRGGGAAAKVEEWLRKNPGREVSILLWGIGDHGGGPSRADLEALGELIRRTNAVAICHSTPESYFREFKKKKKLLPKHCHDINPWAVGCYTSMSRVKQKHRRLENDLYLTEKMASAASFQGFFPYPEAELKEAQRDLAFSEFHDILPGSSIPAAEEDSLRLMDHGLEILSRVRAKAFFALASGEPSAEDGEIPIFVYNPHPFRIRGLFECEFQPCELNWEGGFWLPRISRRGRPVPCQPEKEDSNLNIEWRKKAVFEADLEPGRMNRFECRLDRVASRPDPPLRAADGIYLIKTAEYEAAVNSRTGLLDRYRVRGVDFLAENACRPLVMADNADPWGMTLTEFRNLEGVFELMPAEAGSRTSGITAAPVPSVRVVEDGEVRTIIEAVFSYHHSFLFLRYKFPKSGTEFELEVRVHWLEKDRMLKLSIPTPLKNGRYLGQTAYGTQELPANGKEAVAQKWTAVVAEEAGLSLTCINDGTYGSDFADGEMRLSLLRSPAYSCDPAADPMVRQDRYVPRLDQGERAFRFWINAGKAAERLEAVDREALTKNEKPMVLPCFPPGRGPKSRPFIQMSDPSILVTAAKKSEDGRDLIIRIFEPLGRKRSAVLSLPFAAAKTRVRLGPFEIKTLRLNLRTRRFIETDLLERPLRKTR